MNDHTNFNNLVQASPTLSTRWSELTQKAINDACAHGVTLEPDDVLLLDEVRNAALGAPLNEEDYIAQLLALPKLSDFAIRKAIAAGDETARSATVAELNKITEDSSPARRGDAGARKITRARELGLTTVPAPAEPYDQQERIQMLGEIDDHRQRLRLARKWNLV